MVTDLKVGPPSTTGRAGTRPGPYGSVAAHAGSPCVSGLIRHGRAAGSVNQHEGRIADERHTRRTVEPFTEDAHFGAVAVDRHFGEATLSLGLQHGRRTDSSEAVRAFERHRRLERYEVAG